jgi:CheY-like chemotaxis protein
VRAAEGRDAVTRLVVIDDDDDLRVALAEVLELAGFEVYATGQATEALAHLTSGAGADLILLDLMMPEFDGWEFCARRATDPELARIPVVAITARRHCECPPGVNAVVHKPFDIAALLRVIRDQLAADAAD